MANYKKIAGYGCGIYLIISLIIGIVGYCLGGSEETEAVTKADYYSFTQDNAIWLNDSINLQLVDGEVAVSTEGVCQMLCGDIKLHYSEPVREMGLEDNVPPLGYEFFNEGTVAASSFSDDNKAVFFDSSKRYAITQKNARCAWAAIKENKMAETIATFATPKPLSEYVESFSLNVTIAGKTTSFEFNESTCDRETFNTIVAAIID